MPQTARTRSQNLGFEFQNIKRKPGGFHGDLRSQDVRIFSGLGIFGWAGRKKKEGSKLRSERGLWSLFLWGINPAGFVSPTTEVWGDLTQSKRPVPHLPKAA